MKRILILAALFLAVTLAAPAQTAPSVAGTWVVAYDIASLSLRVTCAVTQDGTKLSGTCTGDDKIDHALTGYVTSQGVTFKFEKMLVGSQITDTFVSTDVKPGMIKGTMSVAPIGVSGTFTATKQ